MNQELTKNIASEIQAFKTIEQKEIFLFLLGALLARFISIQKAAEILEIESETFLELLNLLGLFFSA